ncbi:MAG: tetratricopeptide repeat protein [Flavobacteriaceae bacterium]|nr:tetratricopeptide repeat protein [Flavobacteriaceae bacterium]
MEYSFKEQIDKASLFLQESELEKAIENYEDALKLASASEQKIDIHNSLGRLYQKTKTPEKAISNFEKSIKFYESFDDDEMESDKASIYNNIAAVYMESNFDLAIQNYKYALKIYTKKTELENKEFYPHLANTHFAIAETYQNKEDLYKAKTHFKLAVKLYNYLPNQSFNELKANAHYQLGNIYTEEFNLFDAQVNYSKALKLYKGLYESEENLYKPFLAAVLNNLGVTFKSMNEHQKALEHYQKALNLYQDLTETSSALFWPYVAATFNSLSILYAEMKNFKEAVKNTHKTVHIYNGLTDESPEEYTHYLATSLHNLGLFYFELKEIDLAEKHFNQALSIRKKLAVNQPEAFDADVCATALNLVELHQTQLENKVDFSFKTKCQDLLSDVDKRLQNYDETKPVLKSMKSDCQYYLDYFNQITIEKIKVDSTLKKVDDLTREINSTIYPKEKLVFQLKIVEILEQLLIEFPENNKLKNELAYAYNDLSWLYLRLKKFSKAEHIILKARSLEQPVLSLKCNLAHSYLLQDKFVKAKDLYLELANEKNSNNEPYISTILSDFEKLKTDGINHKDFDKIKNLNRY